MAYVLSSWARATNSHLQSQMFLAKHGPVVPEAIYKRLFREWQKRIIARAKVAIACDDDDPSVILGYCIFEPPKESPPILHYIQVKRDLMRKGIASALLAHAEISKESAAIYTFTSPIQGKVKTPEQWVNVPYWLMQ